MVVIERHTKFKGAWDARETLLMNELETNLKHWYDWAFLGIGAWTNVTTAQTGIYGGEEGVFRSVTDQSYTDGQVWESFRKDWVWETGVEYDDDGANPEPTDVAIYVGGILQTTGSYHLNYPLGRVIFNNPISTTSTVTADYSYRNVQVYKADDAVWWQELQFASHRADDDFFTRDDNLGDWSVGGQHRIQMPCIVVEAVPRRISKGYELGNAAMTMLQDVVFHVLAENRHDRNNLVDICSFQSDKSIWLWDSNLIADSGAFPLDYRGMRTGSNMYTDLIAEDAYRWKKCTFQNATITEVAPIHPNLHEGTVRTTMEVTIGNL